SLNQWIGDSSLAQNGQPFFAVMWTAMTHFPYFVAGDELAYGTQDKYFNRYLNALRRGDEALGNLLHALEQKNLLDSTLVIVVGDHGEQFVQHGTYGHASAIYDENVRVPLILINGKLFHGEEYRNVVGGMIDVAPTVLDLFKLPLPNTWQGRSLFASDRANRVYFFSPWSDFLFGMRDGDRKLIFNATGGGSEVYDL